MVRSTLGHECPITESLVWLLGSKWKIYFSLDVNWTESDLFPNALEHWFFIVATAIGAPYLLLYKYCLIIIVSMSQSSQSSDEPVSVCFWSKQSLLANEVWD